MFFKNRRSNSRSMQLFRNLSLFFVIIAIFICVPLLAVLVGVLVKGIIQLQYAILAGAALMVLLLMIWFLRQAWTFFKTVKGSGDSSGVAFKNSIAAGEAVELSMFGGFLKIAYKAKPSANEVESPPELANPVPRLALAPSGGAPADPGNLVDRIQQLSELKNRGDIDASDYERMKKMLIRQHEVARSCVGGCAEL